VPPFGQSWRLGRPDDNVRGPRPDLLIATRAAVLLRGGRPRHLPDQPVAIRPFLQPARTKPLGGIIRPSLAPLRGRRGAPGSPGPARLL